MAKGQTFVQEGTKGGEVSEEDLATPPVPLDNVEEVARVIKAGLYNEYTVSKATADALYRWVKEREDEIDKSEGRNPDARQAPKLSPQSQAEETATILQGINAPQMGDNADENLGANSPLTHRLSGGEVSEGGGQL